jgi:hypothetical protein
MKILVFLIFFIPTLTFAQLKLNDEIWKADTSRHIPSGSTTIYVKDVKFIDACNAILDAGLMIDKKDNDLQTVQSLFKDEGVYSAWNPIIFIRIKDSIAIIKSEICFSTQNCSSGFYKEKKSKPVQNAYVNGFMLAYKIARTLGTQISFSK